MENPVKLDDISKCDSTKGLQPFSLIQYLEKNRSCPLHAGTLKYLQMKYCGNPGLFPSKPQGYNQAMLSETVH